MDLGDDISALVVASTSSGRLRYAGRLDRVDSGRNFLVGEIGGGDGRLRVESDSGDVTIR